MVRLSAHGHRFEISTCVDGSTHAFEYGADGIASRALCGRDVKRLPDIVDGRTDVDLIVCAICQERVTRAATEHWN